MPVEFETKYVESGVCSGNFVFRIKRTAATAVVVFFSGDISDFSSGNLSYNLCISLPSYKFSLENICWSLAAHIGPLHDILLVRPCFIRNGYAIYSNFALCDSFGTPKWEQMHASGRYQSGETLLWILSVFETPEFSYNSVILVGFSKGCVPILSILFEGNSRLFERIEKIVLIDPGTCGKTFPPPFTCDIPMRIYVTPYQEKEKKGIEEFVSKSTNCSIYEILTELPSLENHFKAITVGLNNENIP